MLISDCSSDVCSSDLSRIDAARSKALGRLDVQKTVFARLVRKIELRRCRAFAEIALGAAEAAEERAVIDLHHAAVRLRQPDAGGRCEVGQDIVARFAERRILLRRGSGVLEKDVACLAGRSEEHTSELQSLMRI